MMPFSTWINLEHSREACANAANNERRAEIARRFKDRNISGYWGCNARVWIRKLIRDIRAEAPK